MMNNIDKLYTSLDKDRDNRNKFSCGAWSLSAEMRDNDKVEYGYLRLYCKRWDCPVCGPKRAFELKKAIINEANRLDLRRFMSLTLDPNRCAPEDSVSYIRNCWNKLRVYLKRFYKGQISFITVLELQKSGYAHLHALVSLYIPQAWLSEAWDRLGGGRVVDIRMIKIERIGRYISKYMTKDLFFSTTGTKHRRYTTSRGISLTKKSPRKYLWSTLEMPLADLYNLGSFDAYDMEKDYLCNIRFFKLPYYILRRFDNIPFSIYTGYRKHTKEQRNVSDENHS